MVEAEADSEDEDEDEVESSDEDKAPVKMVNRLFTDLFRHQLFRWNYSVLSYSVISCFDKLIL